MKISENYIFIGVDTSNYTTSAAVCDVSGNITANIKIPLEVSEGERGLRQSDAVFSHIKNLPLISDKLREHTKGKQIAAVGYSAFPRDAEGSYMPCFLSGKAAASFLAGAVNAPIYPFSHQGGHIMAALYSSDSMDWLNCDKFAAFHVSGGTTEIVIAAPDKKGASIFTSELAGGTRDLNAGQAVDRAGVMMGLKFPCGAEMEKLALANDKRLPDIKTSVHGLECDLSGLENKAEKLYSASGDKNLTSAYVLEFIAETIVKMTENLIAVYGSDIPVLYAGGVMSCSIIKQRLAEKTTCKKAFAPSEFSSDNASGTAILCRYRYLKINVCQEDKNGTV